MSQSYAAAVRHLRRADPRLSEVIARVGPCRLHSAAPRQPFEALCLSIASQQLSTKAAATIFGRFCDLFPDRTPTPGHVMTATDDRIRAAGISNPKISFIRDLAQRVHDGRLDLDSLKALPDDEVMTQLVAVKGIGPWTAEIFLMFRLGRLDILPADDLGLMTAVQRLYGLRKRPDAKRLRAIGQAWRPYRSIASWYLWQSLSLEAPARH